MQTRVGDKEVTFNDLNCAKQLNMYIQPLAVTTITTKSVH